MNKMNMTATGLKKYPTIGVCGLDCGLCPRYYTKGSSRCPGCGGPDFFTKHPSCSYITCCVKKKNLEACGECSDFPCQKFKSEEEYQQIKASSSYPSPKKILSNLNLIKQHGIEAFNRDQQKRIKLLEKMLGYFDDGRSRSFYCKAATLVEIKNLEVSLEKANQKIETENISQNNKKEMGKVLREILTTTALNEGVDLARN